MVINLFENNELNKLIMFYLIKYFLFEEKIDVLIIEFLNCKCLNYQYMLLIDEK